VLYCGFFGLTIAVVTINIESGSIAGAAL